MIEEIRTCPYCRKPVPALEYAFHIGAFCPVLNGIAADRPPGVAPMANLNAANSRSTRNRPKIDVQEFRNPPGSGAFPSSQAVRDVSIGFDPGQPEGDRTTFSIVRPGDVALEFRPIDVRIVDGAIVIDVDLDDLEGEAP